MISYLKGQIQFKNENSLILNVHDVGYEVHVTDNILASAKIGEELELHTHQVVSEYNVSLYGFLTSGELDFYKQLIAVSGIGPKTALSILSQAPVADIKKAIIHGDPSIMTKVSGIGHKTAERIIVELKEKISISEKEGETAAGQEMKDEEIAIDGLVGLGYSLHEARQALRQVPAEVAGAEQRVKEALKVLGQR